MFGTIGHARLKPGSEGKMQMLMDEWERDIKPKIPGAFVSISGFKAGMPNESVFLALAQDEQTYRSLANMPEQDAWYRKMAELVEGDVTWEDVEMDEIRGMEPTA
jgi:hypothetical protein